MRLWPLIVGLVAILPASAIADDLGCVSTMFRVIGANDKVCVSAVRRP